MFAIIMNVRADEKKSWLCGEKGIYSISYVSLIKFAFSENIVYNYRCMKLNALYE